MKRRWKSCATSVNKPAPRTLWSSVLLLGALLIGADAAQAAPPTAPPPGVKAQAAIEGVESFVLENGLSLLLLREPSHNKVTVEVVYRVGSRHEGSGETGIAHLLEHMLFKGSSRHRDQRQEFQQHGADFNAETSVDHTAYYETMLATPDNLRFALDLEADRMTGARLEARDLASEFSVVRNELELGENSPHEVVVQRLLRIAYTWHGYGRDTIGSRSDVENVPIDRLRAFYRRYYQPDNATLIIAGNFDRAGALRDVARLFTALPRRTQPPLPTYTVEPVQDGERTATVRRAGDIGVIGLGYHSVAAADGEQAAAEAAVDILIHEGSGRLYKALVEEHLATNLQGEALRTAEPGMIQILVDMLRTGRAEQVRERLLQIVEELGQRGPSDEELRRFQSSFRKSFRQVSADPQALAQSLAEWCAVGDWRLRYLHRDRVAALTKDAVRTYAARYLLADNRSVVQFVPTSTPLRSPPPSKPEPAKLLLGYRGQPPPVAGEAFATSIDNIEARTRRVTLKNGIKLALLPKRSRGQTVQIVVTLRGGNLASLRSQASALQLLPSLLPRGTRTRTFQQISEAFDELDSELAPPPPSALALLGPAQGFSLTLETTRGHLKAALSLLSEILQEPSFPAAQLEIVRKETQTALTAALQQPTSLALSALSRRLRTYPPEDPRYAPSLIEQLASLATVQPADLLRLHRELFGAPEVALALVGDFEPAEVTDQLGGALSGFRATVPFERIPIPYQPHAGAEEQLHIPDKQGAFVVLGQNLQLSQNDPDYAAVQLFQFMLGGHENARLNTRLREQAGIAYSVESLVQCGLNDRSGVFLVFFTAAPANARPGLQLLERELAEFLRTGPIPAELQGAQRTYRQHLEAALADDAVVAGQLAGLLLRDLSLRFQQEHLQRVLALTPAELVAAARRHIDPARLIKVLAGSWPTR